MGNEHIALVTRRGGSAMAHLVDENGNAYCLHYTPQESNVGGIGNRFEEIGRQGRKPLVRFDSSMVRTLSFSHPLTPHAKDAGNVTGVLRTLMSVAEIPQRYRLINVTDDIETRGWWYVKELQVRITERDEQQQVKTADLSWSLVEANDERPAIAKIPPPPPPPPPPAVATPSPSLQGDYTVVSGDSLWKIAANKLGAGARWREIYDLNQARLNLKAPEMYRGLLTVWIFPGQVLKIPAR